MNCIIKLVKIEEEKENPEERVQTVTNSIRKIRLGPLQPKNVPLMHSPPCSVTVKDELEDGWKIPPCPLDKCLVADGRGPPEQFQLIDYNSAKFVRALFLAMLKAEEVLAKRAVIRLMDMNRKETEKELWVFAEKDVNADTEDDSGPRELWPVEYEKMVEKVMPFERDELKAEVKNFMKDWK